MKRILFLMLCLAAAPASAATSAAASLRHFFHDVHTYTAHFHQVVLDESLNPLQETSGQMWIERPGKFRWEYDPPYRQTIVGDGQRVWVYDIDLQQITVRKMKGALGHTPAILLAGRGDLDENFTVSEIGREGKLDWMRMKPKKNDGGFEDIRLGFDGGQIKTLELVDALGQITRITLSDAKENIKIPKDKFVFTPPKGVDIINADE